MDFGFLYIRDKVSSQATMGLGCAFFLLFIFIPYIVCWLFIPLYVALLVIGALRKFKVDNPVFTFLIPLSGFLLALAIFIVFWWAIPGIVNFGRDCIDIFTLNTGDDFMTRKSIPNEQCYLYFFGIVGGSVGSLFSIVSIGALWEESNSGKQYIERKRKLEPKIFNDVKNIKRKIDSCAISEDEANKQIAAKIERWGVGLGLSQQTMRRYYDTYSIEEHDNQKASNINYKVDNYLAEQNKLSSIVICANKKLTPFIKKAKKQYNNGLLTKNEAIKLIWHEFEKWSKDFYLSQTELQFIWKKIRKNTIFDDSKMQSV